MRDLDLLEEIPLEEDEMLGMIADTAEEARTAEDQAALALFPGEYSPNTLHAFIKTIEPIADLMNITITAEAEPGVERTTVPAELARLVQSVVVASTEAHDAGVIDEPLDFEPVQNDGDLRDVGIAISILSDDRDFKKFLRTPVEVEPVEDEVSPAAEEIIEGPQEEDIDALFLDRI